ncbi:MAG: D-aminoacylase [Steroidobacteraceae bacterium]
MRITSSILITALLLASSRLLAADVLLTNVVVYDGTGSEPLRGDVRIEGERIVAIAPHLQPKSGETVLDQRGLALAPGFIDMHSHGDGDLVDDLDAAAVSRQGVTTILVGQDGDSKFPLRDYFAGLSTNPPAINLASMVGHATIREQVMGKDLYRPSTPRELAQMKTLLARELAAGAFGLSTGLEYEAAHFATTEEVIDLARVAAAAKGFYISHVRDEASRTFDSFDELLRIGREAKLPVEITHIKMGSTSVWHQAAKRMPEYFERAQRQGVDLKADVYPYTFWYSTIRVIVSDRDYFNPQKVEQALAENGGAPNIRIVNYAPEPALAGKTLAGIASHWRVTPVEAYMRIVKATGGTDGPNEQDVNVLGTSMSEDDVRWFIAQPQIMFCTDGDLRGAHPRGAGSFPRILGHYVREEKLLPLALAIHKMTGLPAAQLGLADRGRIAPGYVADLVVFDPVTVIDRSTVENPLEPPLGIPAVMVSGEWVVRDGAVTSKRPGRVLRSAAFKL